MFSFFLGVHRGVALWGWAQPWINKWEMPSLGDCRCRNLTMIIAKLQACFIRNYKQTATISDIKLARAIFDNCCQVGTWRSPSNPIVPVQIVRCARGVWKKMEPPNMAYRGLPNSQTHYTRLATAHKSRYPGFYVRPHENRALYVLNPLNWGQLCHKRLWKGAPKVNLYNYQCNVFGLSANC